MSLQNQKMRYFKIPLCWNFVWNDELLTPFKRRVKIFRNQVTTRNKYAWNDFFYDTKKSSVKIKMHMKWFFNDTRKNVTWKLKCTWNDFFNDTRKNVTWKLKYTQNDFYDTKNIMWKLKCTWNDFFQNEL